MPHAWRILCADDYEDTRKTLKVLFAAQGYEMKSVTTLVGALNPAHRGGFSLYLTETDSRRSRASTRARRSASARPACRWSSTRAAATFPLLGKLTGEVTDVRQWVNPS